MSTTSLKLLASDAYSCINLPSELNSSHKYLLVANNLAKELTEKYRDVHLKLNPKTQDIRPFLWNNFTAIKRYTYVVSLTDLSESSIHSIPEYKKWQHLAVVEADLNDLDIIQHIQFLKAKVRPNRLSIIQQDLQQNKHHLKTLSIKNDLGELLAQMIFNHSKPTAEQLFYTDELSFKRNRGGVFAQYAFMLFFKNKGYTQFDFCGANFKSIALYKSRFPGNLQVFYELWHHQNKLKNLARKFLFHQI
jgi:hypothetical protein